MSPAPTPASVPSRPTARGEEPGTRHVAVDPSALPGVGDAVRRAVSPHVRTRDVHVVVADVLDPFDPSGTVTTTPVPPAETDRSAGREEQTP